MTENFSVRERVSQVVRNECIYIIHKYFNLEVHHMMYVGTYLLHISTLHTYIPGKPYVVCMSIKTGW